MRRGGSRSSSTQARCRSRGRRHRQDLRRRADDPRPRRRREAGRRHGPVAQDDQQPARGGRRGGDRGASTASGSVQKADADDGSAIAAASPGRATTPMSRRRSPRTVDVVAGTAWLFARPEIDGAFDVLFVDEAGQMSLANAVARRHCAPIDRADRRPEPAADGHARASTRPARRPRRSSTSSATRQTMPDPSAACSSRRRGGCTRPSTRSSRRRSTTACSTTHPTTATQRGRSADDPILDGAGHAVAARRRTRATVRGRARRPRSSPRPSPGLIGDGVARRRRRDHGRSRVDDVIVVAPYNAQVAEIQAALEPDRTTRHTSGPSTSSRARKAPSRSTRWRARAGGCAARHGLPVLPQPAQCRDLAGPERRAPGRVARRCSRPAAARRSRCAWSNALCRFVEVAAARRTAEPDPGHTRARCTRSRSTCR